MLMRKSMKNSPQEFFLGKVTNQDAQKKQLLLH